jgi:hypothetical protein
MQRVTGQPPEALAALIEDELRVLTENPYEYEEDDEDQFRRSLPHEVPGSLHGGVLTVQEHTAQVRLAIRLHFVVTERCTACSVWEGVWDRIMHAALLPQHCSQTC